MIQVLEIFCIPEIMIKHISRFPPETRAQNIPFSSFDQKIKSQVCKRHISGEAAACQNREPFPFDVQETQGRENIIESGAAEGYEVSTT